MKRPANPEKIIFDFTGIPHKEPEDIVHNISGVAVAGDRIWTVSDEHHSLQCFAPHGKGYALERSFDLEELVKFPEFKEEKLPPGKKEKKESDLEGLAFDGKHLWFCGAHCRARAKPKGTKPPELFIDVGWRRHILGRIRLTGEGLWDGKPGQLLPAAGEHALRTTIGAFEMLKPFMDLPAKENGLDIEGIARRGNRTVVGLRAPVIAGRALTMDLQIDRDFKLTKATPRFFYLDGLGIRDLVWDGGRMLILAGPPTVGDEPYIVFEQSGASAPKCLWRLPCGVEDHPEAITLLTRNGRRGLLMLADGKKRATGLRYTADWYPL